MKLENNDFETDYPKISDVLERNDTDDTPKLDDDSDIKKESVNKITNDRDSPLLPPISKKVEDESDEPIVPKLTGLYFISLLIVYIVNIFKMFLKTYNNNVKI